MVDCKEAFEEFKRQENARAEEKAKEEDKRKSLAAGQKRRRINDNFKSKNTISSDDESDGNSMSPKSPPAKKLLEKKSVRVKSIISTDEDSDVKSPVKKPEKKSWKSENTPKSELKPKSDNKVKTEVNKDFKEHKRVYKLMSEEEDDMGLIKTPKPEKKKIPKIVKIPRTSPKKSKALENAARFFDKDALNAENVEAVKIKREKKRKKKDPDNGMVFSAPVSTKYAPARLFPCLTLIC